MVDDRIVTDNTIKQARKLIMDFEAFCLRFVKIRNKAGELVPFKFKRGQRLLWLAICEQVAIGKPIRIRLLKYRQLGGSLFVIIFCWWWTITNPGHTSISIANKKDLPRDWLGKLKLLQEQLENELESPPKTKATNEMGLSYDVIDSHYRIGSSEGTTPGMGSTLQGVHFSEKPYWLHVDSTVNELIPAVPMKSDTFIIQESTGLSVGDEWYRDYYAAKNGILANGLPCHYRAIFCPWFLDEEYDSGAEITWDDMGELTDNEKAIVAASDAYKLTEDAALVDFTGVTAGQMMWRRASLVEFNGDEVFWANKFPSTEQEAFLSGGLNVFQQPEIIVARRTVRQPEWVGDMLVTDDKHPREYELSERVAGNVKIWQYPDERYHYVVGADSMWGSSDETDYDSLLVQCMETNKIVAKVKGYFPIMTWGRIIMGIGYHYNTALLAPEVNGGPPALVLLPLLLGEFRQEWRYPNIFVRGEPNQLNARGGINYGWYTGPASKSDLVYFAIQATLAGEMDWADSETVDQMAAYIKTLKGEKAIMGAPEGMHDDDLMARMITGLVTHRSRMMTKLWEPEQEKPLFGSQLYAEMMEERKQQKQRRF